MRFDKWKVKYFIARPSEKLVFLFDEKIFGGVVFTMSFDIYRIYMPRVYYVCNPGKMLFFILQKILKFKCVCLFLTIEKLYSFHIILKFVVK